MDKWRTERFGNLYAEPSRNGLTKPKKVRGSGTKFINMGEVFAQDRLNNMPCDRVPLSELERTTSLLKSKDLLFARQSLVLSGAGKCVLFVEDIEPVAFESHIIRVRLDNSKVDSAYYFYLFRSRNGRALIESIAEQGAGASGIRGSDLAELVVPIPPLVEQQAIASVLGALDDKIDLNRRMNETLEQTARALFKDWFVDFAPTKAKMAGQAAYLGGDLWDLFPERLDEAGVPEGWRFKQLADFCNVSSGKRPPVKTAVPDIENEIPVYGGNGVSWYTSQPLFESPFLITGRVGTLGTVFRVYEHVWVSDNALCFFPKESDYLEFAYFSISDFDFNALNSGSTQPLITQTAMKEQKTLDPGSTTISAFSKVARSLFEKIAANEHESRTLAQTRDLLLPKLMSGELRVRDAEALVAEQV